MVPDDPNSAMSDAALSNDYVNGHGDSQGSSAAAEGVGLNGQHHLKQRRARSQLSCTLCRAGKLKCNRQSDPACDQCIKRNRESTCVYLPPPPKHRPTQNVKGRIRQLENLVVDLMNQNRSAQGHTDSIGVKDGSSAQFTSTAPYSQPTPPSDSENSPHSAARKNGHKPGSPEELDSATGPFGRMTISKNEISYVGESHWGAILNSISDLKRDIGEEEEDEEDEEASDGENREPTGSSFTNHLPPFGDAQARGTTGLGFMVGEAASMTKSQLIASVPEKKVADRLLSLWFNSPDPFKPTIHAPTFQDEYKRFWKSPKETPTMWLGLLFAIMSLASSFGLRDLDPASPQAQAILDEVNKYHSLAASAAVLADFTKPKQYTLECFILYAAGLRSNNAFVNVWLMIGLVVRLALRMGYHRDASHYPSISAFHGEMRRRVWSVLSMIDVLISFQIGLPSIIKTIHSDTLPPRNLLDRDFSVSTKELPPSRGVDELTPSSYTRAKLRIVHIFADAAELGHATIAPSQEETMRLDRELEDAKAAIPPLLQMPDISELVTDPAEQLMCRFNLDLLYLKTKIVLHRRFMLTPFHQLTPEEQKIGIGTSRRACTESALRVLQHHHTIYSATQNGGQLESVKWYMGSISTHDFLLAAMVICLELNTQIADVMFRTQPNGLQCPRQRHMMEALEKSQQIWSDASGRKKKTVQLVGKDDVGSGKAEHMYDETEKASRAMAVMLERVKAQLGGQTPLPAHDAPSPLPSYPETLGGPPDQSTAGNSAGIPYPFHGAVSTYQWDGMEGVPHEYGNGGQVFYANSGSTNGQSILSQPVSFGDTSMSNSQDTSHGASPNEQNGNGQVDFSMIGDMLDVTANLDWQMWDSQINSDQQLSYANWTDDLEDPIPGFGMPSLNVKAGNAVVGGSGPGPMKTTKEIMTNGTTGAGATDSNFATMDFSLPVMENMSVGEMGAHPNSSWGATAATPTTS